MRLSRSLSPHYHHAVILAKRLIYWHGEPYEIDGQTLRFVPGTRPIRLKYADSPNWINRYDALQIRWLWENLAGGDTAIDIGAHAGIYSMLMAAKCGPRGRVIAFEPDPYSRNVIEQNIRLNPSLRSPEVEAYACSDHSGVARFFSGHGDARSALIPKGIPHPEAIEVSLVALDDYLAARSIKPRVVKIDAEGAEIRILKAAINLLASDAKIMCELHPYAWQDFGNEFSELLQIITRAGRWMRYLDSSAPVTASPHYGMTVLEKTV